MTLPRFMMILFMGLVPLAGVRAIWWSDLLFASPWLMAGGGQADFGVLGPLFQGWFAAILTVLGGLILTLILDLLAGAVPKLSLGIVGLLAVGGAVLAVQLQSNLNWSALWPMLGFNLVASLWLMACLQSGRSPQKI